MYPDRRRDLPAERPPGGFEVEAREVEPSVSSGPALMLVAVGEGLYVFESRDAGGTVEHLGAAPSFQTFSGVTGIQAFVPKPFGAEDVLRVVRAVRGFDGRRRPRFAGGVRQATTSREDA